MPLQGGRPSPHEQHPCRGKMDAHRHMTCRVTACLRCPTASSPIHPTVHVSPLCLAAAGMHELCCVICQPAQQVAPNNPTAVAACFPAPPTPCLTTSSADAELVSVAEEHLALMPQHLSFEEAAAIPLVALTAWQVRAGCVERGRAGGCWRRARGLLAWLEDTMLQVQSASLSYCCSQGLEGIAVPPGGRLLVHGGSGGVGSLAVQLAKQRGWHVTATCSPQNASYCRHGCWLLLGRGTDVCCSTLSKRYAPSALVAGSWVPMRRMTTEMPHCSPSCTAGAGASLMRCSRRWEVRTGEAGDGRGLTPQHGFVCMRSAVPQRGAFLPDAPAATAHTAGRTTLDCIHMLNRGGTLVHVWTNAEK